MILTHDPETVEAAAKLLLRRQARRSLSAWARINGFEPARHHQLFIDVLEKATRREVKRVLIVAPRGCAKSTYASDIFPPWFIEQSPGSAISTSSHNATLSEKFAKRSRNRVIANQNILTYQLKPDSRAVDYWETTNECQFGCFGIGGSVLGVRSDLCIIEDPYGSIEEANSKDQRDKVVDWWEYDMRPTLKPNAVVIVISSRYHDDDFIGHLLQSEPGEWTLIKLPLYAEENDPVGRSPGELLWPEYYTPQMEADAKKNPQVLSSQYQQNPTPESGNFFAAENLLEYGPADLPSDLVYYLFSDHAVSEKQDSDADVVGVAGVDRHDNVYILPDLFWKNKAPTTLLCDEAFRMGRQYNPKTWFAGKDHISGALRPFIMKRMLEERRFIFFHEVPHGNRRKRERAQSIRAWMQLGKVFWPRFAPWWPKAKTQLLKFDKSDEDDVVDAISCLGQGLDTLLSAPKPPEPKTERPVIFTGRWLKESDEWRKRRENALVLADN